MSVAKSTINGRSGKVDCASLIHPTLRQFSPVETLASEPERYAAYTREYLGWGVFALMAR